MATNLYDPAYELEKAIRNSDESAKRMFENFRNIQMQLQEKQMMGQQITQEEVEQAQKTVALVQQHPTISRLMEAEQRMSMVIAELNHIIMKPLEDLYGNPNQQ